MYLLTFFWGGESAHTLELLHRWWLKITGSSSRVHHRSIVQGPMSRAAAEVVATEQTAAATEETAEEVIDEVLATAGAEVADLLASKGVTISPAILTLGADVVLQQYSPLSIDGLPDFSQYLFIFLLNA